MVQCGGVRDGSARRSERWFSAEEWEMVQCGGVRDGSVRRSERWFSVEE